MCKFVSHLHTPTAYDITVSRRVKVNVVHEFADRLHPGAGLAARRPNGLIREIFYETFHNYLYLYSKYCSPL